MSSGIREAVTTARSRRSMRTIGSRTCDRLKSKGESKVKALPLCAKFAGACLKAGHFNDQLSVYNAYLGGSAWGGKASALLKHSFTKLREDGMERGTCIGRVPSASETTMRPVRLLPRAPSLHACGDGVFRPAPVPARAEGQAPMRVFHQPCARPQARSSGSKVIVGNSAIADATVADRGPSS